MFMIPFADWPDYTSESDSEASEVEAIVADSSAPPTSTTFSPAAQSTPHRPQPHDPSQSPLAAVPETDHTAQRIMHLLTEIGHSNLVDRSMVSEGGYVNCNHCRGKLLHL